mgnify:CR=1 FL=1
MCQPPICSITSSKITIHLFCGFCDQGSGNLFFQIAADDARGLFLRKKIRTMRRFWIWVMCFLFCKSLLFADAGMQFEKANRAFQKGDFAAAIELYESVLKENFVSAELYYNLGTAYLESGKTGKRHPLFWAPPPPRSRRCRPAAQSRNRPLAHQRRIFQSPRIFYQPVVESCRHAGRRGFLDDVVRSFLVGWVGSVESFLF